MNWLCWHVGTVTDPKFRVIAKLAHTQTGCVIAVWAYLLELAGGTKERGSIASYDADCAEEALGFTASEIEAVIVAMRDKGMIEGDHIAKWKDRQNLTNAERAKEWRKSKAERNEQTDVREHTRPFANATDIQTDTHTDIQTEKEIEAAPPTAAPRPKACRLSDDWNPEPEDFPAQQIARELPKFRDFWKAKSGRDATKLDWQATWRNWLRRSDDFKPARNQAGNGATAASASGAVVPTRDKSESDWAGILARFTPDKKFWPDDWGRRPDREGPWKIPAPLVIAWRKQHGIGQKGEVA